MYAQEDADPHKEFKKISKVVAGGGGDGSVGKVLVVQVCGLEFRCPEPTNMLGGCGGPPIQCSGASCLVSS